MTRVSKGKLERFHRLFRNQFLSELQHEKIANLMDLNMRLWAWIDQVYHVRVHGALDNITPLERYQNDLVHVRPLQISAEQYEKIFYYHLKRTVRKDGTISYHGRRYEVPFSVSGDDIVLIINPHQSQPLYVESLEGQYIGPVTALDYHANAKRQRHRPKPQQTINNDPSPKKYSTVERALENQAASLTSSGNK